MIFFSLKFGHCGFNFFVGHLVIFLLVVALLLWVALSVHEWFCSIAPSDFIFLLVIILFPIWTTVTPFGMPTLLFADTMATLNPVITIAVAAAALALSVPAAIVAIVFDSNWVPQIILGSKKSSSWDISSSRCPLSSDAQEHGLLGQDAANCARIQILRSNKT